MKTRRLAFVAMILLLARPAAAELVTVAYQTEVLSEFLVVGNASILPIGAPVRGSFTYDTSVAGVVIDPNRSRFEDALVEHTVVIQGQTFTQSSDGDLFLDNDFANADRLQNNNAAFAETPTIGGLFLLGLNFNFNDPTETAFSEVVLPTSLDFDDFALTRGIMTFVRREGFTTVENTSYNLGPFTMIPEPGSLALLATAGVLAARRARVSR
ncbi:hypothetical protein MalM25_00220 [Planctomycetes bacterium MalM25]|nr:hypothetical protein MalM25_00220 [Planctomycetes bacterium MalM25]